MKKLFTIDNLTSAFFYLSILIFLIGFHFTDAPPPPGWYQQWMPNLNNQPISDICFLDSLNGYAITCYTTVDTNYILKTSNGGDNWVTINTVYAQLTRVKFLNSVTGFVSGGNIQGGYFIKTTDAGMNWNFVPNSIFTPGFDDMIVLDENTMWLASLGGLNGGIFRTTNGGLNWDLQYYNYNDNPNKIYMLDRNFGFACTYFELLRTTNSGLNWTQIGGSSTRNRFFDMFFIDSLTGWKAYDTMQKTTNGGLNWINQQIPRGPNISYGVYSFSNINKDTIWGTGGIIEYPNLQGRGILYRTMNGGDNWQFQIPDTNINIYGYGKIKFITKNIGWVYGAFSGIHTTTGGDTTWYIGIQKTGTTVPKAFELKQNYPNPFNPRTVIPYSISKAGHVKIIAYDILGREVQRMVDNYQEAGEYEVDFMGKFTSTGVYFYRMSVDGVVVDTKKMILLK